MSYDVAQALILGRSDVERFAYDFCRLKLHEGQVEWLTEANATHNLLLTGNRWGKTTTIGVRHCHRHVYKLGAEARYVNADGTIDTKAFHRERYLTCHAAGLYETAEMVWLEMEQMLKASPLLQLFMVNPLPRSKPHEITFLANSRWLFRTLGDNGEGIDGKSFYLITIDEAGWEAKIEWIVDNVARMRVADVRGCVDLVGTAKPGISQQFFNLAIRAQASLDDRRRLDFASKRRGKGAGGLVAAELVEYASEDGIDLEQLAADWRARVAA